MDYRRFLGKTEELVLPYLGGPFVDTGQRRVRLKSASPLVPGAYRFRIAGRVAEAIEPADYDASSLKKVEGTFVRGYLALRGGAFVRLDLCPEEEPPLFAPLSGRIFAPGVTLFGDLGFESGVEEAARTALEESADIDALKGVSSTLRAAFAYAMLARVAEARSTHVSPHEVRAHVLEIAAQGEPRAIEILGGILQRRADFVAARREAREEERIARQVEAIRVRHEAAERSRIARRGTTAETVEERAERALSSAGADLRSLRRLEGGVLEVRFSFMGERFISQVVADTLNVVDAGICLDGADREVTLESLPSVIREAIETDVLVITRRA